MSLLIHRHGKADMMGRRREPEGLGLIGHSHAGKGVSISRAGSGAQDTGPSNSEGLRSALLATPGTTDDGWGGATSSVTREG